MLAIISVTLTSFCILPTPVLSVPWIMPAPIKTFLATNASIWPAIYVLLGWIVMAIIFYPFVKTIEKKDLAEKAENGELLYS